MVMPLFFSLVWYCILYAILFVDVDVNVLGTIYANKPVKHICTEN